jgi:glucosamine 6-phosphate synthetase-like amidotransferase/phosphosugar isomerase protein
MCGIAGYSVSPRSSVDRTLAAQALLAGIAERGADAAGYAWRAGGAEIHVHKQRSGATALIERMTLPADATQVLVHVRDYTKGHPTIGANNHPVRHGVVVGIHNGVIRNDEQIFAKHGFERHEPEMTVDSEAIFAIAEATDSNPRALDQLYGSMASAWLDERRPGILQLARGIGRPLWLGHGRDEVFFASTPAALEVVGQSLGVELDLREVGEGTLLTLAEGRVERRETFKPDRSFGEEPLPAIRAPHEGVSCLHRLAVIVAAAS